MKFGVLGPLEIRDDDGQAISLTSSKQRSLLAILLCRKNSRVSTDSLLEMLWAADPPCSARTNLQSYVHRLRRRLGDFRIVHQVSGYELTVKPEESDDETFEQLADYGRRALEANDPDSAARLLKRALGLWRGNAAYSDVDHSSAIHAEALRLGEMRHVALELKIDADLALGRHDALIPELTTLVETYPLRQRHYAQLMLGLHRAGRTADALSIYQRARTAMIDELGIEPSSDLRDLERAILKGEPVLAVPGQPKVDLSGVPAQSRSSEAWPSPPSGAPLTTSAFNGSAFNDSSLTRSRRELGRHEVGLILARFLRELGIDEREIPSDADALADLFKAAVPGRSIRVVLDGPSAARRAAATARADDALARTHRHRQGGAR
ncbi:AfsR/SARP family transcriptional regulator [Phytoactinopolyspora endophytica]|uniref:AfsR/SARP family transcriptional regulator n=1 Tax=Phytoactinopolyspora endophytica TaxID=1642495 RepID=UPI00101CC820|nr:AfsR/SARP family transcriptional regulator [Phytoactinopolyspora endophytica]